jgi:predicted phosphoribosyltransferase
MAIFRDRVDAGRKLAQKLMKYKDRPDLMILALPRGGVPVAFEVARALNVPLDILLVRKLGVPGHEELAMGAIASGGVRILNQDVVRILRIADEAIEFATARELQELERRERVYRGDRPRPEIKGRTAIIIDDGLATGASMRAAIAALRAQAPKRIIVAVPTASSETCETFKHEVDEIVCVTTPEPFMGVGFWYHEFEQTTDQEVRELLARAAKWVPTEMSSSR